MFFVETCPSDDEGLDILEGLAHPDVEKS